MATDWVERRDSQTYEIDKQGRWIGLRRFQSSETNLVDNRDDLKAKTWTVNSIQLTPTKTKVISRDPETPGEAIIELYYRFTSNPYDYTVNQARMSIQTDGKEGKLLVDVNGDTIESEPGADGIFWKPVTGSNIILLPQSKVMIKTAYPASSINWATITAGIGKVNDAQLAKTGFITAAAGEFKLLSADVPDMYVYDADDDGNVPIIYVFAYRPGGWPSLSSQKYRRGAIKELVYHTTDDPDGTRYYMKADGTATTNAAEAKFRVAFKDIPVGAPAARVVNNTYDFSTLYSLLTWS